MLVTMVQKTALDQTAESYWVEYYGDYGKMWVREIPRLIKAAAAKADSRVASVDAADVIPFGHKITADRVIQDGIIRDRTAGTSTLFCAEFTHDGELVAFEAIDGPSS